MATLSFDLCLIGAGPASLTLAAAAAQLGARVALVEGPGEGARPPLPPGALTAVALRSVTGAEAAAALRQALAALAPNESAARYRGLGITLLPGPARFLDRERLRAGGDEIRARRFVLSPAAPALHPDPAGLLEQAPGALAVLGGGAAACEAAQVFAHLGWRVTLDAPEGLLPGEDRELVGFVQRALTATGVVLGTAEAGTTVLDARAEAPDLGPLALEAAGVRLDGGQPLADRRRRSSNRCIFVAREAADAAVILKNALFRWPAKAPPLPAPRIVFTRPELAQVGLTEAEAFARGAAEVLRWPLHDNARAQLQGTTVGLVRVVVDRRGRVLGAGIAGERAGELLAPWILAAEGALPLSRLAGAAIPPTLLAEAGRRAAAGFFLPRLLTPRVRYLVRLLSRF